MMNWLQLIAFIVIFIGAISTLLSLISGALSIIDSIKKSNHPILKKKNVAFLIGAIILLIMGFALTQMQLFVNNSNGPFPVVTIKNTPFPTTLPSLVSKTSTTASTPSATSTPTPTPTPTPPLPTATPTPLPYAVSKSGDVCQPPFNQFQSSGWSTVNNNFAFSGSGSNVAISPCNISTPNYSVEATIQIFDQNHRYGVGVVAHSDVGGQNGYEAGAGCRSNFLGGCGFFINPYFNSIMGLDQGATLAGSTHIYKLVVNGTTLQLFYDNSVNPIDTQNLATYLQAGYAGFVCYEQCEVTSFKVIA